jgi:hypothetical protein
MCQNEHSLACETATVLQMKKGKAIPVTGRGCPEGCETSRLPRFLDSRLIDGGEGVSLMSQLPYTSRKIPGTHFS